MGFLRYQEINELLSLRYGHSFSFGTVRHSIISCDAYVISHLPVCIPYILLHLFYTLKNKRFMVCHVSLKIPFICCFLILTYHMHAVSHYVYTLWLYNALYFLYKTHVLLGFIYIYRILKQLKDDK